MPGEVALTPAERAVRGWLCAVFATFLAAASHALAGGIIPFMVVLVSLPLGALVCVILAGQRLTLLRVTCGVSVTQIVFHILFDLFASTPASILLSTGHQHDAVPTSGSVASPLGSMFGIHGFDADMFTSHVIAGALTVAVIRHGERLWWSLVSAIDMTITMIVHQLVVLPFDPPRPRTCTESTSPELHELLQGDSRPRRRGPPALRPSFN